MSTLRNTIKAYGCWRKCRRGSIMLLTLVAIGVVAVISICLILVANGTFQMGRRQPRLNALVALADAGVQKAYWDYQYNNETPPFTDSGTLGPGTFSISVTTTNALNDTIIVTSTATIGSDKWAETKEINDGDAPPPSAPEYFVIAPGQKSLSLTWFPSTTATSYNLGRSTTSGNESTVATGLTSSSYRDTGLKNGKTYYYEIQAVNAGGTSNWSTELSSAPVNNNLKGTLQVNANAAGLTANNLTQVNLTTIGSTDWTEWGLDPFDQKSSGAGIISNYSQLGTTAASSFTGLTTFQWTDGSPTKTETGTTSTLSITGVGNGFSFTAPASPTVRTLQVYIGVVYGRAKVTATLGDGSSKAYNNTAVAATVATGAKSATYAFVYSASTTTTLTVHVTLDTQVNKQTGKISLQGADLF